MWKRQVLALVGCWGYHGVTRVITLCPGVEEEIRNTLSQLPDYFSFWLLVNAMTWMLVSLPGKAHPTGWDYAAVICQTRACSVHLRSGSWDGGDRNHGEDGEFLVGTSGTWRALVPKIWTPLLVILWLHTSQFEGAGGTRWTVPSWSSRARWSRPFRNCILVTCWLICPTSQILVFTSHQSLQWVLPFNAWHMLQKLCWVTKEKKECLERKKKERMLIIGLRFSLLLESVKSF